MILTVTLNPCIDKTLYVSRLPANALVRTKRVELITGGKGMNAARVLKALGAPVKAFALVGGETGKLYERLVKEEGIPLTCAWIDVPTRSQITFRKENGDTWFGVLEEAGMVPNTAIDSIRDKAIAALKGAKYVLLSGSVPSVNLSSVYRQIVEAAHTRGIVTALDTYGRALEEGLSAGPYLAKPNKEECEALVGHKIRNAKTARQALDHMHERGVRLAMITCGRKGFWAGYEGAAYRVEPPRVRTVNPIGSGDATAAGLLYALSNDVPVEQALRWAAAAGAANAAVWTPGACTADQIRALLPAARISRV